MPWNHPKFESRHHLSPQFNMFDDFEFADPIDEERYNQYKKFRSKCNDLRSERYEMPFGIEINELGIEYLLRKKKEFTHNLEFMQSQQKIAGKAKDFHTARFFREELSNAQKYYKGICYAIFLVMNDPPGDCTEQKATISDELAPYTDQMLLEASFL